MKEILVLFQCIRSLECFSTQVTQVRTPLTMNITDVTNIMHFPCCSIVTLSHKIESFYNNNVNQTFDILLLCYT